jgi:DNA-binding NarL/FixJ family response regulator
MGSQIIAVADRFDELTHDAPGRPGLETEVALTTLRPEVGTGFSASIFEALEHSLGRARSHTGRVRPDRPGDLTDRELEVLQLAAKGMSRKDMAHKLYVSESTVRTHLEHIYAKIGVSSRAAATLFAVEHQLLD